MQGYAISRFESVVQTPDNYDGYAILTYNRDKAVEYAHKWAYGRNPAFFDFENFGGDCTNFASQCIFAGCGVMNHTDEFGWYYNNSYDRTASWTGVNFLHNFLVNNRGPGPYAEVADMSRAEPGDIVQLSFADKAVYNHSPVIIETGNPPSADNILVAAHSFDADYYRLLELEPVYMRLIHITGARRYSGVGSKN